MADKDTDTKLEKDTTGVSSVTSQEVNVTPDMSKQENPQDLLGSSRQDEGLNAASSQGDVPPTAASLKNRRTGFLSALTKKRNELVDLLENHENLGRVKLELIALEERYSNYKHAHQEYFAAIIEDETERENQEEIYYQKRMALSDFIRSVNVWIRRAEDDITNDLESASGSRHSSHRSRSSRSSFRSAASRAIEKAKVAELVVEKSMLEKRQRVQAMQQTLELDIKLAKAKAREKAIAQSLKCDVPEFVPERWKMRKEEIPPEGQAPLIEDSVQPDEPFVPSGVNPPTSQAVLPLNVPEPPSDNGTSEAAGTLLSADFLAALTLPHPELPKFDGNIMEYRTFIMAFEARVASKVSGANDRLYYLYQHLTDGPRDLVEGCMHMPPDQGYMQARELLETEYGDSFKLSAVYLSRIQEWPTIRTDDYESLKQFALYLTKCKMAMKSVSYLNVLNHAPHMLCIVCKLPIYLQHKWRDLASRTRIEKKKIMAFEDLAVFVMAAAEAANDPIYGWTKMSKDSIGLKRTSATLVKGTHRTVSMGTTVSNVEPCPSCNEQHDLEACNNFNSKDIDGKRSFLMEKRLCFACFGRNHISKTCTSKRRCSKCSKLHPTSLHIDGFQMYSTNGLHTSHLIESRSDNNSMCTATEVSKTSVLHAILPVRISQAGGVNSVTTYAFYDDGSSGCFMTDELQEQLQAMGMSTILRLKTMNGCSNTSSNVINNLIVSDLAGKNQIRLPRTYTREEIPVNHQHIPRPEVIRKFANLRCIANRIPEYESNLNIGLLIGSNCPLALEPLEVCPGKEGSPYAVRLRHGWTLHGPVRSGDCEPRVDVNRIVVKEIETFKEFLTPSSILQMFERDFNDYKQALYPEERGMSYEDKKFLKMAQQGIQFNDGHFTLPLPFRDDIYMPNNRPYAIKRLMFQKKKMLRDQQYYDDYKLFMDQLLMKGHAETVQQSAGNPPEGSAWYLPHHGVYNVNKPGKIRVVFDCSSSFMGTSLNACLLQGPDLTNSLVGVLTRFREEKVAFMGDIESMFYQVHVPPVQRSYLRFLWWPDGDLEQEMQDYQMTVHLFGAISSPSIANFALRKTASSSPDSSVSDTIMRNFYVDNCLKSTESVPSSVDLIDKLRSTCAAGGFRLTKFVSNHPDVVKSIPKEEQSKELQKCDLSSVDTLVERALGIQWNIKSDKFGFSIAIKDRPFTRRGILSVISSVFDPLGFLSPVMLPAKKLLQDLCKEHDVGWDDVVPNDYLLKWQLWLAALHQLQDITIDRCYKSVSSAQVVSKELHVFADGSTHGYGAVVYRHTVYDSGDRNTAFVIGKSRLAPIKTTTIPRLELTAATTAVRLAEMIKRETSGPIVVRYYTDSTTVLKYIASESKRWPVFVANRVQMIRDFSIPGQWVYVPSELNPADDASRGLTPKELLEKSVWLKGPEFIESGRPMEFGSPEHDPDESDVTVNTIDTESLPDAVQYLTQYFSEWYRLKLAVAIYLKVKVILQDKVKTKRGAGLPPNPSSYPITVTDLHDAEMSIFRWLHRTLYPREVDQLTVAEGTRSRGVLKSSTLCALDPFVEDGVLRVGGRLRRTNLPYATKHPAILPRKNHITSLLIRHIHCQLGHAGRNHVLAELRQTYWVLAATTAVRNIIFQCVKCRKSRGPLQEQKMSDLPLCRLEDTAPPFTCTGVDYFGPFMIRERRKDLKQYGVLFTCLTSRAIHLEVAQSLDTDSFLHALRRFISRRGQIRELYSDNGTNFVGANKELQTALKEMEHDRVTTELRRLGIDWKFNPPTASSMGGSWERLVRTVRKVLAGLLQEHGTNLDMESFHTLLCEVKAIVNSRPLTCSSGDASDLQPLTPNHLLTGRTCVTTPPPGIFDRNDMYVRRRWRRVQYLSNLFWSRWKNEFLLLQQQRQKWNQPRRNLCIGDVVLIREDTTPRNEWLMGLVIATEDDKSGYVRAVKVKTRTSELRRPINKLVLLLPNNSEN